MPYVSTEKASNILGISAGTLRRYADNNQIKYIRSAGGHRLYDVEDFLKTKTDCTTVLYCRVSSGKQRDDLQRQINEMQKQFPEAEVIKDIAGGLNFRRKGLQTILERIVKGDKLRIVVSYRDRLARFGFDVFDFLVKQNGGEIVVLNQAVEQSTESELTEDLLAILHHFSCRMHGRRSHQSKKNSSVPKQRTETALDELVRCIETNIQSDNRVSESSEGAEDIR